MPSERNFSTSSSISSGSTTRRERTVTAGEEYSVTQGNLAARLAGGVPRSVISYTAPLSSCVTPTCRHVHSAGRPKTPLLGYPAPLLGRPDSPLVQADAGTRRGPK